MLGSPLPMEPPPPQPPHTPQTPPAAPFDPRAMLTADQLAALAYMGVDPYTTSVAEIKRLLGLDGLPVPPTQSPPPTGPAAPPPPGTPGQTIPANAPTGGDLTGAAADAAKRLDAALEKNRSAINEADEKLADAILQANSLSEQGKARLRGLQQSIIDEVKKLGPTLDTPAGQQQLADFLQGKTSEILDVLKNAGLDSASHGAVLDGLTARYEALGSTKPGSEPGAQEPGTSSTAASPAGTDSAAPASPATPATSAADTPLGSDPLLDGLASGPLMAGLGSMMGPGLGASSGLPNALGSMMPFGGPSMGSGVPLGDIGAGIASALRDAGQGGTPDGGDQPDELRDQEAASKKDSEQPAKPDQLRDQDSGDPQTKPAGASTNAPPANGEAAPQQVAASVEPPPPAPDTSVKLPDGSTVTADNAALAKAGRAVLGGTSIDDAYQQAGMTLSPPGSPVTSPVSPGRLAFGDIGQYTDHRVMALSGSKVWVNGQVTPLEQLETGPNFLGWERPPTAPAAAPVLTSATAPPPPNPK